MNPTSNFHTVFQIADLRGFMTFLLSIFCVLCTSCLSSTKTYQPRKSYVANENSIHEYHVKSRKPRIKVALLRAMEMPEKQISPIRVTIINKGIDLRITRGLWDTEILVSSGKSATLEFPKGRGIGFTVDRRYDYDTPMEFDVVATGVNPLGNATLIAEFTDAL